jgi:hypothetical protein
MWMEFESLLGICDLGLDRYANIGCEAYQSCIQWTLRSFPDSKGGEAERLITHFHLVNYEVVLPLCFVNLYAVMA